MATQKYPADFRITGNTSVPASFLMPGFSQFAPSAQSQYSSPSSMPTMFNLTPGERAAAATGLAGYFGKGGINLPASAIVSGLSGDSQGLVKGAGSWATGNILSQLGLGKAAGPLAGIAGNLMAGDKYGAFSSGITGALSAIGGLPGLLIGAILDKTGATDWTYKNLFDLDRNDIPLTGGEYAFDDAVGVIPGGAAAGDALAQRADGAGGAATEGVHAGDLAGGDAGALAYGDSNFDMPSYQFEAPDLGGSFGTSMDFGGSGLGFGDLGSIGSGDWSMPASSGWTGGDFGFGDSSSWSGNMLGGLGSVGSFYSAPFSSPSLSIPSAPSGGYGGGYGGDVGGLFTVGGLFGGGF